MKSLLCAILFCGCYGIAYSQQTTESIVNASGGTSEKNNIVYEWSVGELCVINTMESADHQITLTNGCLQPSALGKGRNRNIVAYNGYKLRILPNPATDKVTIHFRPVAQGKYSLMLYNESGEVVYAKSTAQTADEFFETIYIRHLRNGNYFLNVKMVPDHDKSATDNQTFKIIKIS